MIMNVIRPIRASLGRDLPTGVFETSISFRSHVHMTSYKDENDSLLKECLRGSKLSSYERTFQYEVSAFYGM